ncbi:hypothetical protein [Metabacillus sp. 84]|uniref:hypothetical protein n=1 Tax=Metabacillus sp. 84 TaxID=3404705 RepID=UPI003CEC2FB7
MIGWLIIACEIGFWLFVFAGLSVRYLLGKKKTGAILLFFTPVIDLLLIAVTIADLYSGKDAEFTHSLAAIYIGCTIAFGHKMIQWADVRFASRFAGGPAPAKPVKAGREHAQKERNGWYRHFLAWLIGGGLLAGMILLIGEGARTEELSRALLYWSLMLAADFLYSFSYTIWPRSKKEAA